MLGPDQRIRQPAPNDDDRKGAARGGAQNRLDPAGGSVLLRRRLGSGRGAAALNGLIDPGRALPTGTVAGVRVGCFPALYAALAEEPPDHIITL